MRNQWVFSASALTWLGLTQLDRFLSSASSVHVSPAASPIGAIQHWGDCYLVWDLLLQNNLLFWNCSKFIFSTALLRLRNKKYVYLDCITWFFKGIQCDLILCPLWNDYHNWVNQHIITSYSSSFFQSSFLKPRLAALHSMHPGSLAAPILLPPRTFVQAVSSAGRHKSYAVASFYWTKLWRPKSETTSFGKPSLTPFFFYFTFTIAWIML